MSRLTIVATEGKTAPPLKIKKTHAYEMQARFESLWKHNKDQFDPEKCPLEKERVRRTIELMTQHIQVAGKKCVDLGCGIGIFSKWLQSQGADVLATDAATLALKNLPASISQKHEVLPTTRLPDDFYDLVLCLDVIAHLPKNLHRLTLNELARLVKLDGLVVLSTPLDLQSEDALEHFLALVQTEFEIIEALPSTHALAIKTRKLFKVSNLQFLLFLEKCSRFFCHRQGISHVIVIARKKKMCRRIL